MITPELFAAILTYGFAAAQAISDALNHEAPVDAVRRLGIVMHPAHQLALEDAALVAEQRKKAGL